jgi:rare lipoprotein A
MAITAAVVAMALAGPAAAREPRTVDGPSAASNEPRSPAGPKTQAGKHHRKQVGVASVYARRFGGRKMADGTRLDLNDHVAASRTLPLGTEAKVTNLETGQSTRVTIQDRGPYAKGRILDLTPAAAKSIGLTPKEGVAKVEVQPISVPPARDERQD